MPLNYINSLRGWHDTEEQCFYRGSVPWVLHTESHHWEFGADCRPHALPHFITPPLCCCSALISFQCVSAPGSMSSAYQRQSKGVDTVKTTEWSSKAIGLFLHSSLCRERRWNQWGSFSIQHVCIIDCRRICVCVCVCGVSCFRSWLAFQRVPTTRGYCWSLFEKKVRRHTVGQCVVHAHGVRLWFIIYLSVCGFNNFAVIFILQNRNSLIYICFLSPNYGKVQTLNGKWMKNSKEIEMWRWKINYWKNISVAEILCFSLVNHVS